MTIHYRRSQYTLKTMLWLMAVVAALFCGREWGRRKIDWEYMAMRKELGELSDGQMAAAYVIEGYQRVLKKHGIDKSEVEEAMDSIR